MIVKDSMILIHLAKITLLENSCDYFKNVTIPPAVYKEVTQDKKYTDAVIIKKLTETKKIIIKSVRDKVLLRKAEEFNIKNGESEVVALYWQEKADYLATDDDNVRNKSILLNIKIIGTPAIILKLYREKMIKREKFEVSLDELRKIGWFSNAVIDKILMEA